VKHGPFPVECFGGWGKGELDEARGWGASTGGGGGGRVGKDRAGLLDGLKNRNGKEQEQWYRQ
jgi:hypothetical protein